MFDPSGDEAAYYEAMAAAEEAAYAEAMAGQAQAEAEYEQEMQRQEQVRQLVTSLEDEIQHHENIISDLQERIHNLLSK